MKVDRKKLFELYMREVDQISEICDWKSYFTPADIIALLSKLIEENPELIDMSDHCRYCERQLSEGEECHCEKDE